MLHLVDPDEFLVTDVIKRLGDDTIVISIDYPHTDAHFPHALDEFMAIEAISDTSRRNLLGQLHQALGRAVGGG